MLLRGPWRHSHQSRTMIPEIDTSSVVDETESAKVTTESQMAELMRRPETTDGRWMSSWCDVDECRLRV